MLFAVPSLTITAKTYCRLFQARTSKLLNHGSAWFRSMKYQSAATLLILLRASFHAAGLPLYGGLRNAAKHFLFLIS